METSEIVSKNIKDLRLKAGYTQEEVAAKLSYTVQAVSRWERGKSLPDVNMLKKIAELYNVPIEYLFNENHMEISNDTEKKLSRKDSLYKMIILCTIFVFVLVLISLVFVFIEDSTLHAALWAGCAMFVTLTILSYIFRFKKAQVLLTSLSIWCLTTSFYFQFSGMISHLNMIFIGAALLQFLYILYLYFLKIR